MLAKLGKNPGKYGFRQWTLLVKLVTGLYGLKVRATNNASEVPPIVPPAASPTTSPPSRARRMTRRAFAGRGLPGDHC
jgi:hypothetical protein